MREYVVRPGDTLWHVASQTLGPNGDWRVLATLNHICDPKQLRVGQRLKLPAPIGIATNGQSPPTAAQPQSVTTRAFPEAGTIPTTEYVVQPGETLRTIASKVLSPGSDWRILATLNGIADPRQIRAGQRLRIPQRGHHFTGLPIGTLDTAAVRPQPLAAVPPSTLVNPEQMGQTYVVQPGETLTTIASKVLGPGGDWRVIARLNQIADPKQVRTGQRLRLPSRSG